LGWGGLGRGGVVWGGLGRDVLGVGDMGLGGVGTMVWETFKAPNPTPIRPTPRAEIVDCLLSICWLHRASPTTPTQHLAPTHPAPTPAKHLQNPTNRHPPNTSPSRPTPSSHPPIHPHTRPTPSSPIPNPPSPQKPPNPKSPNPHLLQWLRCGCPVEMANLAKARPLACGSMGDVRRLPISARPRARPVGPPEKARPARH
jgi:hypothetical protein